jgi:DNA-binding transcriptional MerR regulator
MKIGELARRTGLTAHTIRYYERIGLLPRPARDGARHRDYDASILTWIEFLGRLKTTGMSLRDMLAYARLRLDVSTEPERQAILLRHRAEVAARIAELSGCLAVIDDKIDLYGRSPTIMEKRHDDAQQQPPRARAAAGEPQPGPLRKRPARAG